MQSNQFPPSLPYSLYWIQYLSICCHIHVSGNSDRILIGGRDGAPPPIPNPPGRAGAGTENATASIGGPGTPAKLANANITEEKGKNGR